MKVCQRSSPWITCPPRTVHASIRADGACSRRYWCCAPRRVWTWSGPVGDRRDRWDEDRCGRCEDQERDRASDAGEVPGRGTADPGRAADVDAVEDTEFGDARQYARNNPPPAPTAPCLPREWMGGHRRRTAQGSVLYNRRGVTEERILGHLKDRIFPPSRPDGRQQRTPSTARPEPHFTSDQRRLGDSHDLQGAAQIRSGLENGGKSCTSELVSGRTRLIG